MKIRQSQLKKIIKEEMDAVMKETEDESTSKKLRHALSVLGNLKRIANMSDSSNASQIGVVYKLVAEAIEEVEEADWAKQDREASQNYD